VSAYWFTSLPCTEHVPKRAHLEKLWLKDSKIVKDDLLLLAAFVAFFFTFA